MHLLLTSQHSGTSATLNSSPQGLWYPCGEPPPVLVSVKTSTASLENHKIWVIKKKREAGVVLPQDPVIPLKDIYLKDTLVYHRDTC